MLLQINMMKPSSVEMMLYDDLNCFLFLTFMSHFHTFMIYCMDQRRVMYLRGMLNKGVVVGINMGSMMVSCGLI